jgi:Arm DNA-binding domain
MAYKLTDKTMKALLAEQQRNPPPKRQKRADGEGHFVSIEPNGSLYFRFKFRFEGVEKEMALGQYDGTPHGVSLGQAREKHQAARAMLRAGKNPIEAKRLGPLPPPLGPSALSVRWPTNGSERALRG